MGAVIRIQDWTASHALPVSRLWHFGVLWGRK
jgi:hypothetical protein